MEQSEMGKPEKRERNRYREEADRKELAIATMVTAALVLPKLLESGGNNPHKEAVIHAQKLLAAVHDVYPPPSNEDDEEPLG